MATQRNSESSSNGAEPERKRSKRSMPTVMPSAPPARESGRDESRPMSNGLATAALIVGIVSIVGILLLGVVLDAVLILVAIVLGILAILKVRRGESDRKGFAIGGLVCGIVAAVLAVAVVLMSRHFLKECEKKIGPRPSGTSVNDYADQCRKADSGSTSLGPLTIHWQR